jgi:hypothetical protein
MRPYRFRRAASINLRETKETDMAWNVPGRCDTEKAASQFLRSPALHKIQIEGEWYDREQIAAKLLEWSLPSPAPEYRAMLDASDVRDA